MLWIRISIRARCTTLCDKVCQWLATGQGFSPGTPVSSTNKTNRNGITVVLLKVELNTTRKEVYFVLYSISHSCQNRYAPTTLKTNFPIPRKRSYKYEEHFLNILTNAISLILKATEKEIISIFHILRVIYRQLPRMDFIFPCIFYNVTELWY